MYIARTQDELVYIVPGEAGATDRGFPSDSGTDTGPANFALSFGTLRSVPFGEVPRHALFTPLELRDRSASTKREEVRCVGTL